jgi:hypothetical protein
MRGEIKLQALRTEVKRKVSNANLHNRARLTKARYQKVMFSRLDSWVGLALWWKWYAAPRWRAAMREQARRWREFVDALDALKADRDRRPQDERRNISWRVVADHSPRTGGSEG